MANTKTAAEKIFSVLTQLENFLDVPKKFALTTVFSFNELAKEYAQYIIEDGIIIKQVGGNRGPAIYKWNKDVEPTMEIANRLADRYAKERGAQERLRGQRRASKTERILMVIEEIKEIQLEILNKLNSERNVAQRQRSVATEFE